jgi:uncharacterized membrane protein HdeD (DUF308 family)
MKLSASIVVPQDVRRLVIASGLMESSHHHVTRNCCAGHALGNAGNGQAHSLWYLIQGALMVLGGVLALVYPVVSSVAVVLFLGWVLIISGVVQGIRLIGAQHVPHFWLQLISVVLSVIVGVLFVRQPGEGLLAITLLLIVFFMVEGISKLVFALTIRPFPNWGWVLTSGVIGILLSLFLWASLAVTAIWLLGALLGIHLICEGAALGYLAWQVRQS